MRTLKILNLVNESAWASLPGLVDRLKSKTSSFINLEFYTNFLSVPFTDIPFVSFAQDQARPTDEWIDRVIRPLGKSHYDVVLFTMSDKDWKGGACNGYTYGGEIPVCAIHANEGEVLFHNKDFNAWYELIAHEMLGHGFHFLTGQEYPVHFKRGSVEVYDSVVHEIESRHRLDSPEALVEINWSKYLTVTERVELSAKIDALMPIAHNISAGIADLQKLVHAIIMVESGGNDKAVNPDDGGSPSYGCMQIKDSYLADVNEVLKTQYKGTDLIGNRPLSIKCFLAYINRYASKKLLGRAATLEDMARIHNGGPNGWEKTATLVYWQKVQKYL